MAPTDAAPAAPNYKYVTTSEDGLTPALVIAAGAVLPILGIFAVALRFYSRVSQKNTGLGIDDWLILAAIILTTGLGLMLIIGGAKHGLSQPTPVTMGVTDSIVLTEQIFFAFNLVQCWAFGSAKLSVLFFYRRIFRGRWFDIVSWFMIVVVCIWTIGFFFAILFRCGTKFWALWAPLKDLLANCYSSTPLYQGFSYSDVITDVLILIIPIYWVSRLQLLLPKRLEICGVFLLGLITIAAGIVRLVKFIQQTNNFAQNLDGIGHLTTEMYWSMIEMGISVIVACLPTIRFLVPKVNPESIIRSIRSRFTLASNGSRSSVRNRRETEATTKLRSGTSTSAASGNANHESIELADRPAQAHSVPDVGRAV